MAVCGAIARREVGVELAEPLADGGLVLDADDEVPVARGRAMWRRKGWTSGPG